MERFEYYNPVKVVFGEGYLSKIGEYVALCEKSIAVYCIAILEKKMGEKDVQTRTSQFGATKKDLESLTD